MKLSIVIPVLNSEKTLGACLGAIASQTMPRADYEIVIADAGSSDRTVEIAKAAGVVLGLSVACAEKGLLAPVLLLSSRDASRTHGRVRRKDEEALGAERVQEVTVMGYGNKRAIKTLQGLLEPVL